MALELWFTVAQFLPWLDLATSIIEHQQPPLDGHTLQAARSIASWMADPLAAATEGMD